MISKLSVSESPWCQLHAVLAAHGVMLEQTSTSESLKERFWTVLFLITNIILILYKTFDQCLQIFTEYITLGFIFQKYLLIEFDTYTHLSGVCTLFVCIFSLYGLRFTFAPDKTGPSLPLPASHFPCPLSTSPSNAGHTPLLSVPLSAFPFIVIPFQRTLSLSR